MGREVIFWYPAALYELRFRSALGGLFCVQFFIEQCEEGALNGNISFS